MSSVKPVYNIVTDYKRVKELSTGVVYDCPSDRLHSEIVDGKEKLYVELALIGPTTYIQRKHKMYVEYTEEPVNWVTIANIDKQPGGNV